MRSIMRNKKRGEGFSPVPRKPKSEQYHIRKPNFMILSDEYKSLSPCSKAVMDCMQIHHFVNKYTAYGGGQAAKEAGHGSTAISAAFSELMKKGFIRLQENYNHSDGKTRTWEMTWMSYFAKPPRDLWR